MKNKKPNILLLGSNSGNNLGDAAILSGILDSVSKVLPEAEFVVPSHKPKFINENYGKEFNVKGISFNPWTFSIRFLGFTTFKAMKKADIAMICDGIIFGKNIFNPLFNYLNTLVFLVPWAKITNTKLVCYSCGIGPFRSKLERVLAKFLINNCDLVIMRDNDSKKLAQDIGVTKDIHVTGDPAFVNPVNDQKRAIEVMKENNINPEYPILGINVTKYIDGWLGKDEKVEDRENFLNMLSDGINSAKEKINENIQTVLFSTHPMDEGFCRELASKTAGNVIDNSRYLSHDIQAVMRESRLFIGMRFHSVVLSTAVGVPVIALIYAPKVKGMMRLMESGEYGFDLKSLTSENFSEKIISAWNESNELQEKQQKIVRELISGAYNATEIIRDKYFPNTESK